MSKQTLAIVGSGWAAFPLTQSINLSRYNVKVISPSRTLQYTPLLASAACGLFDVRLAEEPIRRQHRTALQYYKATAENVDLQKQVITCLPSVEDLSRAPEPFLVEYDKIEHALFLRTTNDARILQQRFLQMLDAASLPGSTEEQQRDILHIHVVAGGAIGIEATAELFDLWHESMRHLYPHLDGKVQISIHDVAPQLLTTFDQSLSQYAMQRLKERKVEMKTSSHIERVEQDAIYTKEDGRLPFGMLLWATGNKASPLLEKLDVKKPEHGLPRILTDKYLRVLRPDGTPVDSASALGDAADVDGQSLPTLASVALQKGEYLTNELNKPEAEQLRQPYDYKSVPTLAYIGAHDGVIGGSSEARAERAWLAWRSGSLAWTRSWRRKVMITMSWLLVWLNGRDISRP